MMANMHGWKRTDSIGRESESDPAASVFYNFGRSGQALHRQSGGERQKASACQRVVSQCLLRQPNHPGSGWDRAPAVGDGHAESRQGDAGLADSGFSYVSLEEDEWLRFSSISMS